MPAPTRPTNYSIPFANAGTRNTIPAAPTGTNKASFTEGFPPITMQPITTGGLPPSGDDFNGLFYDYSSHIVWVNAGGQYQFDAALSTAMGGYPKGMVLQNNAGTASYVSLIDNNTNNFNTDPTQIGLTWGAYSGAAFSNASVNTTGGNTSLTAIQAIADMITVTGTLTSNATITIPAVLSEFLFVNSTTGAFSLTVLPLGGTGVPIKQGAADAIYCDGTNANYQQASAANRAYKDNSRSQSNTSYADRAADRIGGYYADTGAVNAYVVATVPATTSYENGQTIRFTPATSNTLSTCTLNAGAGAKPLVRGDGSGPRPNDILSSGVITATYVLAIDKFVINGLIVPDASIVRKQYSNSSQTFYSGDWLIDTSAGSFGGNLNSNPIFGDAITFADATGSFRDKPFTLAATGGYSIVARRNNGSVLTDTVLIDNTRGHVFTLWFNGTDWEMI